MQWRSNDSVSAPLALEPDLVDDALRNVRCLGSSPDYFLYQDGLVLVIEIPEDVRTTFLAWLMSLADPAGLPRVGVRVVPDAILSL